jgi:hypothetical protein
MKALIVDKNVGLQEVLFDKEDKYLFINHKAFFSVKGVNRISTYLTLNINGQRKYFHRIVMGSPLRLDVDHINGNTLDNRKSNLRICTRKENIRNRQASGVKNKSSQYKGVFRCNTRNTWKARIQVDFKQIHLGSFRLEVDAARAYNEAATKYFGAYARLNKI